jgi:hypothetical protein
MADMSKADLDIVNRNLQEQVNRLQEELAVVRREQSQTPSKSDDPPPSPPPRTLSLLAQVAPKDLKLDPPPEFNVKTCEYAMFIGHCEFYFMNKPAMFGENECNDINFVISRLCDHPSTWANCRIGYVISGNLEWDEKGVCSF